MTEQAAQFAKSDFPLEDILYYAGLIIILCGFIAGLHTGLTLKALSTSGYYLTEHPQRWIYAVAIWISSIFPALICFALSEILKRLPEKTKASPSKSVTITDAPTASTD